MEVILEKIGENGPLILFLSSLYLLRSKENYLLYYGIGFVLNIILNFFLKGIIQERRPCIDEKLFNLAVKNGQRFKYKDGVPLDIFGMPSGHAQMVFYSLGYIYLALNKFYPILFYLIISLITIYQRVKYNFHTIFQVIVGSLIGVLFGYFIYFLATKKIIGKLNFKIDDYGPYIK